MPRGGQGIEAVMAVVVMLCLVLLLRLCCFSLRFDGKQKELIVQSIAKSSECFIFGLRIKNHMAARLRRPVPPCKWLLLDEHYPSISKPPADFFPTRTQGWLIFLPLLHLLPHSNGQLRVGLHINEARSKADVDSFSPTSAFDSYMPMVEMGWSFWWCLA